MCRWSGRGCTVMPCAPASRQIRDAWMTDGMPSSRVFRSVATLLTLTLSFAIDWDYRWALLTKFADQVLEFGQNELRHRQLHRLRRPRHGEQHLARGDPAGGAAEHCAAADLFPAQHAEQFAKT